MPRERSSAPSIKDLWRDRRGRMDHFIASTTNLRTGKIETRSCPSADNAAGQLYILLEADGWTGDKGQTISDLVAGQRIIHKGFEYSVISG
jgi:hypothetical protein